MRDFRDYRNHKQIRFERLQRYWNDESEAKASLEEGLGDWCDGTGHRYDDGIYGYFHFVRDNFATTHGTGEGRRGFLHSSVGFWWELATLVVLDTPPSESLLATFKSYAKEFKSDFVWTNQSTVKAEEVLDEELSVADRRVIAWYEGWRIESPKLVLGVLESQPAEALAFSRLRERVFSSLRGIPYNEWPGDMDIHFDAERAALLALLLLPLWQAPLSQWPGGSAIDLLRYLLGPKSGRPALLSAVMNPHYAFNVWSSEGPKRYAFEPLLWLVAESQGASIRRIAQHYGVSLTSRQISQVLMLPSLKLDDDNSGSSLLDNDLMHSIIKINVQILGGTDVELRRIGRGVFHPHLLIFRPSPSRAAFFRSAVTWLARWREELSDEQAQSIMSWARHRYTEDGHFSFSRRTVKSALEHAREYEREIERRVEAARTVSLRWAAHGWNLEWVDEAEVTWHINELTDQLSLAQEGAVQSHCVGGYAMRCLEGTSAILQLLRDGERAVTIEVRPKEMRIAQALGRFNSVPSEEAMAAIRYWANSFGIALSRE